MDFNLFCKILADIALIYLLIFECLYFYFKTYKKDVRFLNISFFKFFDCPVKTFRGDFIQKQDKE